MANPGRPTWIQVTCHEPSERITVSRCVASVDLIAVAHSDSEGASE